MTFDTSSTVSPTKDTQTSELTGKKTDDYSIPSIPGSFPLTSDEEPQRTWKEWWGSFWSGGKCAPDEGHTQGEGGKGGGGNHDMSSSKPEGESGDCTQVGARPEDKSIDQADPDASKISPPGYPQRSTLSPGLFSWPRWFSAATNGIAPQGQSTNQFRWPFPTWRGPSGVPETVTERGQPTKPQTSDAERKPPASTSRAWFSGWRSPGQWLDDCRKSVLDQTISQVISGITSRFGKFPEEQWKTIKPFAAAAALGTAALTGATTLYLTGNAFQKFGEAYATIRGAGRSAWDFSAYKTDPWGES